MKKVTTLMLLLFTMILMAQDKIYVHTATADNTSFSSTYLDHPDLNGNPNAEFVYSLVENPGGSDLKMNSKTTGLWYDSVEGKWAIFNEDVSDIVIGTHYNIYITDASNIIEHIATPANVGTFAPETTIITDPMLDGANPGPHAIASHYWNPNQVFNESNSGFYFDTGDNKRGMFNYDGNNFPDGSAFKILVNITGSSDAFTHISDAGNVNGNFTFIDNPALNGNPNATFVFSHYWGQNGSDTEVFEDKVFAAYYTGAFWAIAIEDGAPMIEGLAFDIVVAPEEVLGVNDNELSTSLILYPNPSTDIININASLAISKVSVYNVLGQQVILVDGNETNSVQINISELTAGNYFVKVEAEGSSESIKFIKK